MEESGDKDDFVRGNHHSDNGVHEPHSHNSTEIADPSHRASSQQSFQIRPQADARFRPSTVKDILDAVLSETLAGKKYSDDNAEKWTKSIANTVRNRIKDREFKRYKLLVQVVLGEKHGAGVKIGARCLWDADTDNYVKSSYTNETLFCSVTVFAVYMY